MMLEWDDYRQELLKTIREMHAALKHSASAEEIAEAPGVAISVNAGAALV